jgi:hypothetical protein
MPTELPLVAVSCCLWACDAGGVVEPLLSVLRSRCIHEHPAKLAAMTQASITFLIMSSHVVDSDNRGGKSDAPIKLIAFARAGQCALAMRARRHSPAC